MIEKNLAEIAENLKNGKISSVEITEKFIAEIEKNDQKINSFVTTTFDFARKSAAESDARRKKNSALSEIDGIPISLKDVISTKKIRTTAASKILENYFPPFDATVWKKLKNAGAVLLGKNNTDEFTMGASTENSAFFTTKNPHDFSRVAGGSSGGSAAAVAANFCAASIGTDTGGSIRQPAAFCGATGLKVSYGRVSRFGTIPMASSLDTIGPIAKTARDCAIILQIIAGRDKKDSTTPDKKIPNYLAEIEKKISGTKIGIPREYFETDGIDPEILEKINLTKKILKNLGAEILEISLPHTKFAIPAYYLIAPSEISANMSKFDGIRFGQKSGEKNLEEIYKKTRDEFLGDEVKRRILLGTFALSAGYYDAFYKKAQKVRTLIKKDFDENFQKIDAILTPVSPTPAFKIGKNSDDPLKMYLEDIFTVPASLAGICGISIPVGTTKKNLPIGAQILGPQFSEEKILRIAHQIQNFQK